jgi:hypothetical protein
VKKQNLIGLVVVTIAIALGTWAIGWWSVPVIALIAGLLNVRALVVGAGCAIAWALLLIVATMGASFGKLAAMLAGVMGLPAAALIAITILFPFILGWSAAAVGNALRSIRPVREHVHHIT